MTHSQSIALRPHGDSIRERIRLGARNRRDMILIPIHNIDNLHSRLLQTLLHSLPDLDSLCKPVSVIILGIVRLP